MYYEQKLRKGESYTILKKIVASESKRLENLRHIENIINSLEGEVALFKRFSDSKAKRHSGALPQGEMDAPSITFGSGIYDWIVDINLISNVQTC